jgi:23S rRNA pseudouridine1911/1915/1917 synthase
LHHEPAGRDTVFSAVNSGFEYREQVGARGRGLTVLAWLVERYRHSGEATWRARIERGEVLVDGAPVGAAFVLRTGQTLAWRRPPWEEETVPLGFAVLYRDAHLLAVAKPRGLPSVPNGGFLEHTLLHRVRLVCSEAVPMHRLGRGTSGLLLFARTAEARRSVAAQWRAGEVEKEYLALVRGRPGQDTFTVDLPIGPVPHPRLGLVHAASPAGKPASSLVRVLASDEGRSLVAVRIGTGRPHQVRIHLAGVGHPLVGDPLYAPGGRPREQPGLPGEGGYRLHSHRLGLSHPETATRVDLVCAAPRALDARSWPTRPGAPGLVPE